MIHIMLGTRAQLIKMAPIMMKLDKENLPYNFIYTGQHRCTIDDLLREFRLRQPDRVLYRGGDRVTVLQTVLWLVRVLVKCMVDRRGIFGRPARGIVLVHGDTLSTIVGAVAGRMARLRVGHVESGLRSFNLRHPFPEELIRICVFRLSHALYCPGRWALRNVESLGRESIDTVANTLADTLAFACRAESMRDHIPNDPFGLVSLHRYENIFSGRRFDRILGQIEAVAVEYPLLFVLHPSTESQLRRLGLYHRLDRHPGITLRRRYGYCRFVSLLQAARFVITDGGSIQEECTYLGKPCLLMRDATERLDGLEANVRLSRFDPASVEDFVRNHESYRRRPVVQTACASDRIVDHVRRYASAGAP